MKENFPALEYTNKSETELKTIYKLDSNKNAYSNIIIRPIISNLETKENILNSKNSKIKESSKTNSSVQTKLKATSPSSTQYSSPKGHLSDITLKLQSRFPNTYSKRDNLLN